MINLFLSLLILSLSTQTFASQNQSLDELMSPSEIWQELQEQQDINNAELSDLYEPLGFFDFLRPKPPEPPMKEWNAILPEESVQMFGMDWFSAYDFVLVINKSAWGPTAQTATAYVQGQNFGTFRVSTGRETNETSKSGKKYFSNTPTGWFHPTWLSRNHVSKTWEAPMPFAVFFNGGIATHAALPAYYDKLGSRASGGCVRFHPSQAQWIFEQVQRAGKGLVPEFTKTGEPVLDSNGVQKYSQNYRSLIIVVNREN